MRVAIVGATGNAGTSVLRALQRTSEVEHVVGIARRMPDTTAEPYRGVDWRSIDIAAASSADTAEAALADAFADVDAVIHLAWLIQPNRHRELLRRVNVEGTRRVAAAAAAAGVGHLIVASSVGAYSPDRTRTLRDETWPAGGIQASHYGADKAAQERVLDEFAAAHDEIVVTRLRPALIFHDDAASQIQRYFLHSRLPVRALRFARPPIVPLPAGLRGVQTVHGDDLGRAYAAAVLARRHGAFNICADDMLTSRRLASIAGHGRVMRIPDTLARAAMAAAYRLRVIAADPGWLDLGLNVPMMSNAKAKTELDWHPQHSAADAVESLLEGMIAGEGTDSVPMRPRDVRRTHDPGRRRSTPEKTRSTGHERESTAPPWREIDDRRSTGISPTIARDLMNLYMSDHLTGATAGAERIERMAHAYVDTPVYAPLSELADEIRLEREFLRRLIRSLGLRRPRHRQAAGWVGERVGRLKSNGRLTRRSPMTLVLEAELMRSAVAGKQGIWQTLSTHAAQLELDPQVFDDLEERGARQIETLSEVHAYARERAFRTDRETYEPHTEKETT